MQIELGFFLAEEPAEKFELQARRRRLKVCAVPGYGLPQPLVDVIVHGVVLIGPLGVSRRALT
jgi:hypothetical protein